MALRIGKIKLTKENIILSRSAENTQNFGKELWQKYEEYVGKRAIVFALEGQLGAGKTQFVKGLARAMGIKNEITSPTFSLMNDYKNLFHLDVWRVEAEKELEDLGFAKIVSDKSVIAVEWADRVADIIRRYHEEAIIVWVKIKYGKLENERIISWGTI